MHIRTHGDARPDHPGRPFLPAPLACELARRLQGPPRGPVAARLRRPYEASDGSHRCGGRMILSESLGGGEAWLERLSPRVMALLMLKAFRVPPTLEK